MHGDMFWGSTVRAHFSRTLNLITGSPQFMNVIEPGNYGHRL